MAQKVAGEADVIIVGAGPAGSSTAIHLAKAGLHPLVIEKATFPREKTCGDGLTPRAVRELSNLGIDPTHLPWKKTKGLRIHVSREAYRMPWPELHDFPDFGMVCRRSTFDQFLADQAVAAGTSLLSGCPVTSPVLSPTGDIVGVTLKDGRSFSAPVVVEASGGSARLAVAMGIHRITTRPMGIAVRTYFRSPLSTSEWLDSWLELWDGEPEHSNLLPGYGWSFPEGDGTCNVGLGLPDGRRFSDIDYRGLLTKWLNTIGGTYGFTQPNRQGTIQSAALPMGFNRKPTVARGLMLVGDSAGAISPFTGEGISYAMESGRFAAEAIINAHARGFHTPQANTALTAYSRRLTSAWGRYFWLGNLFGQIISHPTIMRISAHYGLPVPFVRQLTNRMLADLADHPAHDVYSAIINTICTIAPEA